jgi:hypothetical protein
MTAPVQARVEFVEEDLPADTKFVKRMFSLAEAQKRKDES